MFCKKCGREIPDDSVFCQHCGERLKNEPLNKNEEQNIKLTTNKTSQRESSAKTKSTSNIIANEIVANIKMIGLGLVFCILYLVFFWLYHIPDRKPVSEVEFHYSQYDNIQIFPEYNKDDVVQIRWINNNRKKEGFLDLKNHFYYSIFFSIGLMIVGRYLIKIIKWVAKNRTE